MKNKIWPKWEFAEEIRTQKGEKIWFGQQIGSRWVGSGSYSARIDPTGFGKPIGSIPDPKTAIKKLKMSQTKYSIFLL